MARPGEPSLPVLLERTLPESEYRRLASEAARAESLAGRVEELERELADARRTPPGEALDGFAAELLPTLDDLDRALAAARPGADPAPIAAGVELVKTELLRVLATRGIEPLETAVGERFDIVRHQALDLDGLLLEEAWVVEVLRPGYTRAGRLLRPAIVRLSSPAPESGKSESGKSGAGS